VEGERRERVAEAVTNADGRTDGSILPAERFAPGPMSSRSMRGEYLRGVGTGASFLDLVPVRFGMETGHYHVPLLLAPFGYSTYRGS
jgi:5-hydroxyisourate hydrolase